jgi:hypothetical protein
MGASVLRQGDEYSAYVIDQVQDSNYQEGGLADHDIPDNRSSGSISCRSHEKNKTEMCYRDPLSFFSASWLRSSTYHGIVD